MRFNRRTLAVNGQQLNVIVEGRDRFRIVEETTGREFMTAEVELLLDNDDPAPAELAEQDFVRKAYMGI